MALRPIQPLQCDEYLGALGQFPGEIIDALFVHEPLGWAAL